jgi:hypothetical protein
MNFFAAVRVAQPWQARGGKRIINPTSRSLDGRGCGKSAPELGNSLAAPGTTRPLRPAQNAHTITDCVDRISTYPPFGCAHGKPSHLVHFTYYQHVSVRHFRQERLVSVRRRQAETRDPLPSWKRRSDARVTRLRNGGTPPAGRLGNTGHHDS